MKPGRDRPPECGFNSRSRSFTLKRAELIKMLREAYAKGFTDLEADATAAATEVIGNHFP